MLDLSQECFDFVVEKFRQERLPELQAAAAQPPVGAPPLEPAKSKEGSKDGK